MMHSQLINGVVIDWDRVSRGSYLRNIPAISGINHIAFTHPVTFFVGENGSGKSTLLEAIATTQSECMRKSASGQLMKMKKN